MPHISRPDGCPHQGLPWLLRLFERKSKTTQKYQYPPFAGTSDSSVSLLDSSSSESSNSLALMTLAFLVVVASSHLCYHCCPTRTKVKCRLLRLPSLLLCGDFFLAVRASQTITFGQRIILILNALVICYPISSSTSQGPLPTNAG